MTHSPLRVLVVDDSALYRKILRSVLGQIPGVDVVGAAADGRVALARILAYRPDLITLDVEMPELDGLALLAELKLRGIDVPVIMVSAFTAAGAKSTTAALKLEALDFVLKPAVADAAAAAAQLLADLAPKIEACRLARRKAPRQAGASEAASRPADAVGVVPPKAIGIGISTGGPAALAEMLPRLPADFPCPILVVQHMPPLFTKSLADDLDRACPMQVSEGVDGAVLGPGQIVIAPGGKQMRVATRGGRAVIQITDDPPERNCKPAVNYLFRSLADEFGHRAWGVVLTGMGDDGALGCRALKARGATIIAQDEASSVVYGMPRSAIETGAVDAVLPLDRIAQRLRSLACQEAAI